MDRVADLVGEPQTRPVRAREQLRGRLVDAVPRADRVHDVADRRREPERGRDDRTTDGARCEGTQRLEQLASRRAVHCAVDRHRRR